MKKTITFGIIFIVVGATLVWFFVFKNKTSEPSPTNTNKPTSTNNTGVGGGNENVPPQHESTVTQPDIARDFLNQIENSDKITLYNTFTVAQYALQDWGDENKGGQALLQYTYPEGWKLLDLGGGAWDVSDLVSKGVPRSIAEQLIQNASR